MSWGVGQHSIRPLCEGTFELRQGQEGTNHPCKDWGKGTFQVMGGSNRRKDGATRKRAEERGEGEVRAGQEGGRAVPHRELFKFYSRCSFIPTPPEGSEQGSHRTHSCLKKPSPVVVWVTVVRGSAGAGAGDGEKPMNGKRAGGRAKLGG